MRLNISFLIAGRLVCGGRCGSQALELLSEINVQLFVLFHSMLKIKAENKQIDIMKVIFV